MIEILDAVDAALEAKSGSDPVRILMHCHCRRQKRLVTTGGHFAYLKIAEGCDKHCTYCIIPKVRGNFRSVPMERLAEGSQNLADAGGEGADPGGTGDDHVWNGSLREKRLCISF